MQCPDHTRRSLILTALATGACLATESASSEDDKPGSDERRQKGDLLVVSEGEHVGERAARLCPALLAVRYGG